MSKAQKWPPPAKVLRLVVDEADDGYCLGSSILMRLFDHDQRAARSGVRRAIRLGLLLERRGPDGLRYVAVSSEGWRSLEAADPEPEPRGRRRVRA
jgi:hypothetical protein